MNLDLHRLVAALEAEVRVLPARRTERAARSVREAIGLLGPEHPNVELLVAVAVLEDLDRVLAGGEVLEEEDGAAVLGLDLAIAERAVAAVEVLRGRAEGEERVPFRRLVSARDDAERAPTFGRKARGRDQREAGQRGSRRERERRSAPPCMSQRTASATIRSASTWFVASFSVPTSFASFQRTSRSRMRAGGPTSDTSSASASGTAATASIFLPSR